MHFQFEIQKLQKLKKKKQIGIYIPHSSVDFKCGVNRTPAVGGGSFKPTENPVFNIPYKKKKKSFLSRINEYMIKFNKKVKAFLDYIDDEQFY